MTEPTATETIADAPNLNIKIRPPTNLGKDLASVSPNATPPPSIVTGTWHVTHSTLPMWKKARNVAITYTPLSNDTNPKLDDKVTYQGFGSSNIKTVSGIDTPSGNGSWSWRGKGWLMIASSHWQILGYGEGGNQQESWAVTYFQKTLFTPAGIDIYSRRKDGLSAEIMEGIEKALAGNESDEVRMLAKGLFEVKRD